MTAHAPTPSPTDTIPRAPTQAVWDALSPEERAAVVASLPAVIPALETAPEGDDHWNACAEARLVLGRHFARRRRRVYVSGDLFV